MEIGKLTKKLFNDMTIFFFGIAILIMISIFILSLVQFRNLLKAGDWVDHTYKVVISAQQILDNLSYIESMQRGYRLFNDNDYKTEYLKTIKLVKYKLINLSKLVADNISQHDRISEINTLVQKRLQILDKVISSNISGNAQSPEV